MLFDIDFDVSIDNLRPVAFNLEQLEQVKQFLYAEARYLDQRQWEQWLDLWTEDGMYWAPHSFEQTSPYDHISLFWENKMLRELRMKRLENARNWSQQPPTRSSRLISNVSVLGQDSHGYLVIQAAFQVIEWRKGEQRVLGGSYIYKLKTHQDTWQIYLKQVNLVDREDVHSNLEVHL
ncbi:benzoate/toluate 1,2-dioxygenase beta subunit [Paenalcaligenes hominis]|uniref:Benzoate/toluate 1,2-dioxygenase beta subunit n=1 Tax=Paenalcaligenes hominis TaxID=643674 RepID=A0ABX0WNX5_9BURK|nr:aromatic-ring-hydroxylating dioxygenase subunit beta [Paenalcaligenes hominis]NJB64978.1 benzoate/toluate 1,2-dioxygenase beta subunit [Paenalcaligenes hominis]GGE57637.1 hypothetical protein GCM10007278_02170 [Paenalcaligenes hominis]